MSSAAVIADGPGTTGHWATVPLKHVATLKGRLGWQGLKADQYTEHGPFLVTSEHFVNDKVDWARCYHVSQERFELAPDIQLQPGDLMIMKDGAAMGKLAFIDELPGEACLNSHLLLFRPKNDRFVPRYLYYVLRSPHFQTFLVQERTGTTFFGISQENIGNYRLSLPPLPEQTTIATFLDHETAKIDALVEEQKRLIELLKEKRQAVISHAVTKGLNPDARMKDSGIEWLGEVPEHWEVMSLRRVCQKIMTGRTPTSEAPSEETLGVPWFTPGDFGGSIDLVISSKQVSANAIEEGEASSFPSGSVLIVGIGATLGRVGYIPQPSSGNQQINAVVPGGALSGEFLAYSLAVKADVMRYLSNASTIGIMNQEKTKEIVIAVPPLGEQQQLLAHIRNELAKLSTLALAADEAISLLSERRSALISAAVTGKIDVRKPAIRIDNGRVRLVIGRELVHRLSHRPTFGRVKLQKLVYLAEAYAGVVELSGRYSREAAGPLDRALLADIESLLKRHANVAISQPDGPGGPVRYKIHGGKGNSASELNDVLGNNKNKFDHLVDSMADLDTKGSEAVATLFAVWNDALIDKEIITDDSVVLGVLTNWHPEKSQKFRAPELHTWLGWMRRHNIVPTGRGPQTLQERPLL